MKKYQILVAAFLLSCAAYAQTFTLEEFATGFNDPVDIKNAGDDRLFIVEQGGRIKILNADGSTNPTAFLDIASQVSGGSEQGLLGLAFHPDYATNGYFYVNYTKNNGDTRISRFSVSPGDPDVADASSELDIMDIVQPFTNHNGGAINFGADGFLYISTGDGGAGGDPGNRSQNTTILLGKLLRIDVDNPANGNNYGIPADNPFAGSSSDAQEIWAYGLRNAWKFSFDSDNADVWIADVGQNAWEEINKAGGDEAGLNYGWRCYEANAVFDTSSNCPDPSELVFPIGEYNHSTGFSITGGYVYRGSTYTDLQGYYFFADFGTGLIGTIDEAGQQNNVGTFGGNWSSFGEDVNNELYISGYNGQIFKIEGEIIAGVNDINVVKVSLSPNPASTTITINAATDRIQSINVFDVLGKEVLSRQNVSSTSNILNIENLVSGVYLVKVATENGTAVKKMVVQ